MLISLALQFSIPLLYRTQGKKSKYFIMSDAAYIIDASAILFLPHYNLIKNVGYYLGNG